MCQSTGFLKTIVFFINFLLLLAGLALLVIGVAVHVKTYALTDVVEGFYQIGPIATIVVGGVILLFSFLGCCGAVKESNCMLITYSIFILVLMILKLALAGVVFFNSNSVINFFTTEFSRTFVNNQSGFHQIETSLTCCGPHGPFDYGTLALPETCCPPRGGECTVTNAYRGCNTVMVDIVYTSKTAIGGALSVVAALELLAVTFVMCLAKNVRNKKSIY